MTTEMTSLTQWLSAIVASQSQSPTTASQRWASMTPSNSSPWITISLRRMGRSRRRALIGRLY